MATRVIQTTVCDRCGDETGNTSVPFSIRKTSYELDLCDPCETNWMRALSEYVATARRLSKKPPSRSSSSSPALRVQAPSAPPREERLYDNKAVRAWAASNQIEVPKRGKIPEQVLSQFLENN
jgi:hypothetical protein